MLARVSELFFVANEISLITIDLRERYANDSFVRVISLTLAYVMLNVKQIQIRGGKLSCIDKYCIVFYSLFFIILVKQTKLRWVELK